MKEDKLDKFIKHTLKDDTDLSQYADDISIPVFEDTISDFKENLKKKQEVPSNDTEPKRIKKKATYKSITLVAATFVIAVGLPIFHQMISNNQNGGGLTNNQNEIIQIPNPLTEVETVREAEKACGFPVEKVNYMPNGYTEDAIVYLSITDKDKLVRQIFTNKNAETIDFQKHREIHDVKSDWNVYNKEEEVLIDGNKVILSYKESELYKANWSKGAFAYEVLSSSSIKKEEMIAIIENID